MSTPVQEVKAFAGLESPPFSPSSSIIERPILSSRTQSDLRQACAEIVRDSNPSSHDYEDLWDRQDALQRHADRRNANKSLTQDRVTKAEPLPPYMRKHQRQPSDPTPGHIPYVHIPKNAATGFEATVRQRQHSLQAPENMKFEPFEPIHTTISSHTHQRQRSSEDPLAEIRANLDSRPKTSAAACIDYTGPSVDTSASTSRTNTTYDGIRPSTGLTSLAITPGNEKRSPAVNQRVSEQILGHRQSACMADATAKAWMAQELNRRRKEAYHGGAVRPPSRSSLSSHRPAEPERPVSRAGSIKSGIKEYIRPRASMESVRSTRSDSGFSRSNSHGTNSKAGSWWRGNALRRKGSWSSFRSAKADDNDDELVISYGKDGSPDLNRSLPPLPGLDQYKEKKAAPTHIAQMMRAGNNNAGPKPAKNKNRRSVVVGDDGLERTRSGENQRQRMLRIAVEEKMRVGSISPPTSPGIHSLPNGHQHSLSSISNGPGLGNRYKETAVMVQEVPKTPTSNKKEGFRRRLSRFFTGSDKSAVRPRGKVVAAN
ncbi:hypothetical protein MMC06_005140 [Schaereria dolodes]|nr:hypothetical protein [Schaereria dolodes]